MDFDNLDFDNGPPPQLRLITQNTHLELHEAKAEVREVNELANRRGALRVNQDRVNVLLNSNTLAEFENLLGMRATQRNIRDFLREDMFEGRRSRSPKSKKMCMKRHMKWISKKAGRKGRCVKKSHRRSRK